MKLNLGERQWGEVFGLSCEKGFLSGMSFSIYEVVGLIISPISTGA